uniref:Uncharacterized protein n=1 Tax=Oryza glumipatula TaxID=40148 RepID=A0A0D9ZJJ2_9ORYZ
MYDCSPPTSASRTKAVMTLRDFDRLAPQCDSRNDWNVGTGYLLPCVAPMPLPCPRTFGTHSASAPPAPRTASTSSLG